MSNCEDHKNYRIYSVELCVHKHDTWIDVVQGTTEVDEEIVNAQSLSVKSGVATSSQQVNGYLD